MQLNGHEIAYRSEASFKKIQTAKICICGVGALGSNLVNNLTRQGFTNISIIDMDRVEQKNISTQVYFLKDVGQKKVAALKAYIYQATKIMLEDIDKELKVYNADKMLKGFNLIVDTFDNWESRRAVRDVSNKLKIPCVHAGMSDDGFSEIKWNENYIIPNKEVKQNDICDYPLAANLVQITTAILAEAIVQFFTDTIKINREITLKDVMVHKV